MLRLLSRALEYLAHALFCLDDEAQVVDPLRCLPSREARDVQVRHARLVRARSEMAQVRLLAVGRCTGYFGFVPVCSSEELLLLFSGIPVRIPHTNLTTSDASRRGVISSKSFFAVAAGR